MKKCILIIAVISFGLIANFNVANSQIGKLRVALGLATIDILGENYTTLPLIYRTSDSTNIRGGGFNQTQSGIRLEAIMPVTADERFEIPVGLEYVFFRAKEKSVTTETGSIFTYHSKDIAFLTLGLNYNIFILEAFLSEETGTYLTRGKLYAGIDSRLAIIDSGEIKTVIDFPKINKYSIDKTKSKGNVRMGFNLNLGINGELSKKILVDLKCGVGIINLIGKNDDNGELLTYYKAVEYTEKKESFVWSYNLAMTLQYKF